MSRAALENQGQRARHLKGAYCAQVSLGHRDGLVLDFGELHATPDGQLAGDLTLLIDCPWRIDSEETGVIGWQDAEEDIVDFATVLIDATIDDLEVRRPGFDLILEFSNGHSLRVFPDCRAYFDDELAGEALPWQVMGDIDSARP